MLATTGLTTIITAMEQAEPIQHLVTTGRQADTQLAQAILRGNLAHVQTLLAPGNINVNSIDAGPFMRGASR